MNIQDMKYTEFTEALAGKSSVPGGGGASALVGAIGIALGTMVGNFTVGKKKYADVEADILALMDEAEKLRVELLKCIEEDAEMFEPLSKAYGIPKEDPNRDEIMEKCLRDAAEAPLKVMRLVCRAIELQKDFAEKGSTLMISDAGTGVVFCWSALYGAALNVRVNTRLMKDREYAEKLNLEADELMNKYWKIADNVYESVFNRLK